jgi:transcriptional regulator with XRE-family HTH domain
VNKAQISLQAAVNKLLKKGFTQDEIAAYSGVSQVTISRYARGLIPVRPKKALLEKLRAMAETSPAGVL